eukprot:TRINITY_DN3133_c0_g1_i1.p1 TRINITY_DN3133_c0_g1~~TRINITY_DN3133_c0_g1_i1.p1  ORF type:complete len:290 (+),score=71.34 TRINITY_DN3133_c0_g1_i1:59-928(+)
MCEISQLPKGPEGGNEEVTLLAARGAQQPEMLQAGFKAQFLKKVGKMDWTGLDRTEILLELALIGCPLAIGAAGAWLNARRWNQRKFTDVIHYSLNTVTPQKNFRFRTLGEDAMSSILHPEGAKRVQKAADFVTTEKPIIELDKTTTWLVNNAVANQLSAMCSQAFLARDMGVANITSDWYIVVLTAEPTGVASMKKIRAMVIKESLLRYLATPGAASLKLENPHYIIRWELLKKLAQTWADSGYTVGKANPKFFRVELCAFGEVDESAYPWLATANTNKTAAAVEWYV